MHAINKWTNKAKQKSAFLITTLGISLLNILWISYPCWKLIEKTSAGNVCVGEKWEQCKKTV